MTAAHPPMSTQDQILSAAYRLLYRDGFARTGMDAIAEAAGVTKRTLYYHFDSKDALVAAVLDAQHALALARIGEWGRVGADSPADYVAALFLALEDWARRPHWLGSGFTRLSMELAHMPGHPARRAARRHKTAVEARLAVELARRGAPEAEALARRVLIVMEGGLCLTLVHGDASYLDEAGRAAAALARATSP